jgi:hypothetical protein
LGAKQASSRNRAASIIKALESLVTHFLEQLKKSLSAMAQRLFFYQIDLGHGFV